MTEDKKIAKQLQVQYSQLVSRLGKVGLVLQGTITERKIVRETPKDPSKEKTYGPYYQWTFKKNGKTTTINLTAGQAKSYQKAIDNNRELENIIKKMKAISLLLCQYTTAPVKKRKRRAKT
ncbi:MAG: hypothetical protein KKD44_04110 [Proteobacteria bacterium]|nr:hypothetical protein [Pseudomonadota bacterium]